MTMTTQPGGGPRRLRAAIIGFGLDGVDSQHRLSTGDDCLVVGGSAGDDRTFSGSFVFHDGEVVPDGAVAVWIGAVSAGAAFLGWNA